MPIWLAVRDQTGMNGKWWMVIRLNHNDKPEACLLIAAFASGWNPRV
ncbi:hypothetical protein [uncultured Desulfosarcina sp.]|nr:hypothetical protein [uncultured Desulfosarcina sp.]